MSLRPDSGRERVTAGKRNRKVTVERFTATQDPDSGENTETWSELKTVMAGWRRATARETLAASEVGAVVTDVFSLPWNSATSSITPLDRLVFDNRTYDVIEAAEIGFREGMAVTAAARSE